MVTSGVTIVVSPLIALMSDQVQALLSKGVDAACLTSALTKAQQNSVLDRLRAVPSPSTDRQESSVVRIDTDGASGLKVLFVAPERFGESTFMATLSSLHQRRSIAYFAIDEAHCISTWGHDFRPAFKRVSR